LADTYTILAISYLVLKYPIR